MDTYDKYFGHSVDLRDSWWTVAHIMKEIPHAFAAPLYQVIMYMFPYICSRYWIM